MRHTVLAVCFAVCSLLANGCSKGISRATAATVLSVTGRVVFGDAERNNFQSVTLKSRIRNGDTVRSSGGALVDLAFITGAPAGLSGDPEFKIEALKIATDAYE